MRKTGLQSSLWGGFWRGKTGIFNGRETPLKCSVRYKIQGKIISKKKIIRFQVIMLYNYVMRAWLHGALNILGVLSIFSIKNPSNPKSILCKI